MLISCLMIVTAALFSYGKIQENLLGMTSEAMAAYANHLDWRATSGRNNKPLGRLISKREQKAEPSPLCIKGWPPARSQTHQLPRTNVLFPQIHGDGYCYHCAYKPLEGLYWFYVCECRTEVIKHMVDPSHFFYATIEILGY